MKTFSFFITNFYNNIINNSSNSHYPYFEKTINLHLSYNNYNKVTLDSIILLKFTRKCLFQLDIAKRNLLILYQQLEDFTLQEIMKIFFI